MLDDATVVLSENTEIIREVFTLFSFGLILGLHPVSVAKQPGIN